MADSRAASVKCRVTCDEVTLRLTLTDRLLQKSLQDAVVAPFLVAFRKRSQADVRVLRAVEVDGAEVDPGAPAGTVLGGDEPHVVLRPLVPTRPRGDVVAPAGTVQNAIVEDDEGRHSRAPHASSPGTQTVAGPDAMDMSQLSGMLKGMQHLLPPDLRKRAEQLTPEQVSVGLKLQAPPSNAESAYAGVDYSGAAGNHVRSGPPVARSAGSISVCARGALRDACCRAAHLEEETSVILAAATSAVRGVVSSGTVTRIATIDGRLLVVVVSSSSEDSS